MLVDTEDSWSYTSGHYAKVVELVDTQGSGPCARKGVRVRVPPFAPRWLPALCLLMLALATGCAKKDSASSLLERSMEIFDGAIIILEESNGHQEDAEAALRTYLAENREEIRRIRTRGSTLMKAMTPAEKKEFSQRAEEAQAVRHTRLENLARTYKDPMAILSLARLAN